MNFKEEYSGDDDFTKEISGNDLYSICPSLFY